MIKVHIIDGSVSFSNINNMYENILTNKKYLIEFVFNSLIIKKKYIQEDEFDKGIRNIFNYGHSFGHAIESATAFKIPHGIAVTLGMDMANYISMKKGILTEEIFNQIHPILFKNYSEYFDYPIDINDFMIAISKDKKNIDSSQLTLIFLDKKFNVFKDLYANDLSFKSLCQEYFISIRSS